MLQRTRADQVVPVYEKFVKKYSSFELIAKATKTEITTLFSSLGLTWRARNAFKLVKALEKTKGEVPNDLDTLKQLPGVGDYVAKAVLCYAFGMPFVPVDTNVVRVFSRVFGIKTNSDSGRRSRRILDLAQRIVPAAEPQAFNIALLDFAAVVCKPVPICPSCPMNQDCRYFSKTRSQRHALN